MSYDENRISDQIDGGLLKLAEQDEQNYTEQPFNLETALKHPERVYFRNGEKPLEWHWFEKSISLYPITIIGVDGNYNTAKKDGQLFGVDNNDLILRVPYVTKFAVLLLDGTYVLCDNTTEANREYYNRIACVPVKIPAI